MDQTNNMNAMNRVFAPPFSTPGEVFDVPSDGYPNYHQLDPRNAITDFFNRTGFPPYNLERVPTSVSEDIIWTMIGSFFW
jgi:hypothetical protein